MAKSVMTFPLPFFQPRDPHTCSKRIPGRVIKIVFFSVFHIIMIYNTNTVYVIPFLHVLISSQAKKNAKPIVFS